MKPLPQILIHNGFDISFEFKCFNCVGCLILDLSSSGNGSFFNCVGCLSDKNLYQKRDKFCQ